MIDQRVFARDGYVEVSGMIVQPQLHILGGYHRRLECEYSISVSIDFEPTPAGPTGWPLCLDTADGPVAVDQRLGDGLFYRGRQLPHCRSPLPAGCRSTSIFLHYV